MSMNQSDIVSMVADKLIAAGILDGDGDLGEEIGSAVDKLIEHRDSVVQTVNKVVRMQGEVHKRDEIIAQYRKILALVGDAVAVRPSESMLQTIRVSIRHALTAPPVPARLHPVEGERTDDMASPG